MVKLKGPLISEDATGSISNSIIYQRQRSTHILRKFFKPKNPKSKLQKQSRQCVYCAHLTWASMSQIERQNIEDYVSQHFKNITPINWFVKLCQLDQIDKLNHI